MARKFKTATASGTFDHFHKGHKHFLQEAFKLADTIYIGVTSDTFQSYQKYNEVALPYVERREEVSVFLKKLHLVSRSKIFKLVNIHGPTLTTACPIEAIIVTGNTLYGAELINKLRAKKRLLPLAIEQIPYLKAVDGGDLSSSRIRGGEIDRQGNLYVKKEWLQRELRLPEELRSQLQKPIGTLIKGSEEDLSQAVGVIKQRIQHKLPRGWRTRPGNPWRSWDGLHRGEEATLTVTVGDVVASSFNEGHLIMDIAIVDYHVKRAPIFKNLLEIGFKKTEPDVVVENPKGTLTVETFKAVQEAIRLITPRMVARQRPRLLRGGRSPLVIRIVGEEDLATLAVVLAAPLGTHVFYGQPNEGIVQVVVTEEKKVEIRDIVSQFE